LPKLSLRILSGKPVVRAIVDIDLSSHQTRTSHNAIQTRASYLVPGIAYLVTRTSAMAPRTLATLATVLSAARDADAALTLLNHEAAEIERSAQLVLFICDSRRQLITERLNPAGDGVTRIPLNVSIDQLPAPIRRSLNSATSVADFGAESEDYMKLLGISALQQGGILSVRGLTLDGELAGFIALYEPRRRFGPRIVERLSPAFDLFALAFERIAEHEARFEAVRTLEELTRDIHSEYNRAVRQLKAELQDARDAVIAPSERDAARIADLERRISETTDEVQRRAERLHAVEDQVSQAVSRLQQAHVDLHSQTEMARAHANLLYKIERAVSDANGSDAPGTLEKVKELLATRS
jgi:hypothetical protein